MTAAMKFKKGDAVTTTAVRHGFAEGSVGRIHARRFGRRVAPQYLVKFARDASAYKYEEADLAAAVNENNTENKMKYQPHEYTCIQAWGDRMRSFEYYIVEQQKKAAAERAPITAIYERDGVWAVAEDIVDPSHRKFIMGNHYDEEKHGQYGTELDVEEDRFDRLPRVCAAMEYTHNQPILITRGEAGYHELRKDFDVDRFNAQRRITAAQVEAMLAGSLFGFHTPGSDPKNCTGEGV